VRVVLDANVVIAAAASRGLCESVFELCLERHELVCCDSLLEEIEGKLRSKLRVTPSIIAELLGLLRTTAELLVPEPVQHGTCRDAADEMVLGLVAPGRVDVIVTGDKDLLVLGTYSTARILTPREFWDSVARPGR